MKVRIAIIGTLDTKGKEIQFLRHCVADHGAEAVILDVSCRSIDAEWKPDYSCAYIAGRGHGDFRRLSMGPRTEAAAIMARGAASILLELIENDRIDAVMAIGGGTGTGLGCEILRTLPTGLPKIMLSAVAAADMTRHLGTRDIVLFNTVVDICLNRILEEIFRNAAEATLAMAKRWRSDKDKKTPDREGPLVGATMYGITQPCVFAVRDLLEPKGYEFVIFTGGGMGPTAMENLAYDGKVDIVLDLTTTSLIDEVVGGIRQSGEGRLLRAGLRGVPQVIAPGAIDVVNFGPPGTVPPQFHDRVFYRHTEVTTLMRADSEESVRLAELMAGRLNEARGPVIFLIPLRGFSKYDSPNGPPAINFDGSPSELTWYDPDSNRAFAEALRQNLADRIVLREVDAHINDPEFAREVVAAVLSLGIHP
jgi:uncharacterized protein (UPF0261 family)